MCIESPVVPSRGDPDLRHTVCVLMCFYLCVCVQMSALYTRNAPSNIRFNQMYVLVCVCVCTCMYECVHACMCVHIYMCVTLCMCVCSDEKRMPTRSRVPDGAGQNDEDDEDEDDDDEDDDDEDDDDDDDDDEDDDDEDEEGDDSDDCRVVEKKVVEEVADVEVAVPMKEADEMDANELAMALAGAIRGVVGGRVEVVEAVVMNGGDAVVTNGVVVMLSELGVARMEGSRSWE